MLFPVAGATSSSTVVWSEGFEGNPSARGVVTVQAATPPSTGALTSWNLINTSALTTQLTWDGSYEGSNFYYVGLNKGTNVASGFAYTGNADSSLILLNRAVPANLGYQHALLSFALSGSSQTGQDFLWIMMKPHSAPDSSYVILGDFTGQGYQNWADSNGVPLPSAVQSVDASAFMGQNVDVRFRFTSTAVDTSGQIDIGWNVDSVQLTETDLKAAPSAPQDLVALAPSGSLVNLSWQAPASDGGSALTEYTIFRGTSPVAEAALATVPSGTTVYSDGSVANGTTYTYSIAASNALGMGPKSTDVTVTPGAPIVPPSPPTALSAGPHNGVVDLSWTAPASDGGAPVTAYDIYRSTSPGTEAFLASAGTALSYQDTGIADGVTYYYRVAAANLAGVGTVSAEANATAFIAPSFQNYAAPLSTDGLAGEPSLGMNWKTNNAMMQLAAQTWRIAFDTSTSPATATWTDVSSPFSAENIDPILVTDPATGRTFAGGDDGPCLGLSYSDNDGTTWLPVANACPTVEDHPTVGWGVPSTGALVKPLPAVYPDVVYVCQQEQIDGCAASENGGVTFGPVQAVTCYPAGVVNPGLSGHVRAGPDGVAYLPFKTCSSTTAGLAITRSDGQPDPTTGRAWSPALVPGIASGASSDPSIAVGRGDVFQGGRLYFAAEDGTTHHGVVATSTDDGTHWSAPVDITVGSPNVKGDAVGVQSIAFPEVIAGDDNRAAFAFLGTKDAGNAFAASFNGTWDLYVAYTYDGGQSWVSADATPSDPVQRGWICLNGAGCGVVSAPGRNLLDFMDINMDSQGRVLVGYPDGCIGICASGAGTAADSTSALGSIARQTTGLCLLAQSPCGEVSSVVESPQMPLIPTPQEDQCAPNVVIFSSNSHGTPSLNSHAVVCLAEGSSDAIVGIPVNTAFINPGSDRVQVRYTQDLGIPQLIAEIHGLADATVVLNRTSATGGGAVYDSPYVSIDPTAQGSVTALVELPDGTPLGEATFHTAGSGTLGS